jgi:hypothetical protein
MQSCIAMGWCTTGGGDGPAPAVPVIPTHGTERVLVRRLEGRVHADESPLLLSADDHRSADLRRAGLPIIIGAHKAETVEIVWTAVHGVRTTDVRMLKRDESFELSPRCLCVRCRA